MPVQCTCLQCESIFLASPYRASSARFCSVKCKGEHRTASQTIEKVCLQCGSSFRLQKSFIGDGNRPFCSRTCYSIYGEATRPTPAERFWAKVDQSESCWIWQGGSHRGYGQLSFLGKPVFAHKFAWWLATGYWPTKDEPICHDCPAGDNPSCVRNDGLSTHVVDGVSYVKRGHLWLGTQAANMADMVAKGRQTGRSA